MKIARQINRKKKTEEKSKQSLGDPNWDLKLAQLYIQELKKREKGVKGQKDYLNTLQVKTFKFDGKAGM